VTHDARSWASALLLEEGGDEASEARASALEAISHALAYSGDASRRSAARFLDDPSVADSAKAEALIGIIPDDKNWAAFMTLVVRRRASSMLPAMAIAYRKSLDERSGTERVTIESARPLDSASKAAILGAWQAARRASRPGLARIVSDEVPAPELIGGFRLKSGSIRYDASIAGKLKRLEAELARPLERPAVGSGGPL
jgi:F0F1-type ATP synthase delta subunit